MWVIRFVKNNRWHHFVGSRQDCFSLFDLLKAIKDDDKDNRIEHHLTNLRSIE